MSDIFQEVEEDLRRERLRKLWDRFGIYIILVAVLIVAITAGYRGYEAWRTGRERAAGDAYLEVVKAVDETGTSSAVTSLIEYADDAPAGFQMLARFRAAAALSAQDDDAGAADILRGLAADSDVAPLYRDLASLRLAQILIDEGDAAGARKAIGGLSEDSGSPYYLAAQELMGLAAYTEDDLEAARQHFATLRDAAGAPQPMVQRARLMLALITQTAPDPADADGEAAETAQETN
ncbi:tetratricopeptide repeat protein [Acuticoccus mangrovi]|uniref:Tetratricopeptide repeat protein n=1 Tax=Acuticoccus mangrovi TaxID=2796142 RepID=A0A934IQ36_9HYPH|nr:tetratricopeptide repeat protein [Acuticoccus mangrovi]MBJ3776645.1 tetratricopeptide repeat protein [Acuticoccus mangrovi]